MPAAGRTDEESDTDPDPVITAERTHLIRSRKFLRLMREDVLSLRALGGDPVSEEYLKADLSRRAEALRDMPDTPLFFGRLDYRQSPWAEQPVTEEAAAAGRERFYIGRRHVHDPGGHPVVIDWRAPVSRPFYRASRAEPMGLDRRRRFGFAGGELTAYEDEDFATQAAAGAPGAAPASAAAATVSRIMLEEIERPRSGPMRDIVATIQPDQDDIVRAGADQTICVQGAPGTGKTAVGPHRIAYLLYAHRERMGRRGVLVVGPSHAFLSYIRNVLPALGETEVTQITVADLVASRPGMAAGARDDERAAQVKGDARMAGGLAGALRAACARASARPGSVAVITADEQVAGISRMLDAAGVGHAVLDGAGGTGRLTVVPVTLAKGLEFDQVIVVEPTLIAAAGSRGPNRLYVALTRAVSRLTVLHAEPLPALLR